VDEEEDEEDDEDVEELFPWENEVDADEDEDGVDDADEEEYSASDNIEMLRVESRERCRATSASSSHALW